ncbi:unnamed protein product [Medioppia subpectinata]|uniref:Uncharacterized protein n=1 Tax=Medioppia subpectinata TaxID=1979941 RepID=A0A7R9KRG3_9ACAR|nr:unnamed protein product [Medioppia subpectinata]CAG2108447.1 unnamed protein product [Medioppia subpectinata]
MPKIMYQNLNDEKEKKYFANNTDKDFASKYGHKCGKLFKIIIPLFIIIIAVIAVLIYITSYDSFNTNGDDFDEIRIKNGTNPEIMARKSYKVKQRVILNEKYFRVKDCGHASDTMYPQFMSFEPTPINVYRNMTMNWRILLKSPLQWTTQMDVQMEKVLFGLDWLKIKIPCFMDYFGSCNFNFCKMMQLHWDEQMCDYVHTNYNISCQCPDTFALNVFELNDFNYSVIVDRVMKYFSWFANGWYNLNVRIYDKVSRQQGMCIKLHFNIDNSDDE